MKTNTGLLRAELIGLGGIVERNIYLIKRYVWWEVAFFLWTVANTLTIVFIAEGVEASGGTLDVNRQTTILLIGAVIWAYLGNHLRDSHRDRCMGALGGHDRVHLHGSSVAHRASRRHGCVRRCLRSAARRVPLRSHRDVLRPSDAAGQLT